MAVATESFSPHNDLGYKQGLSFHELLDVFVYSAVDQCFATVDGRTAVVYRLSFPSGEILSPDEKRNIADALSVIVDGLPDESTGQFIRQSHRDIRERLGQVQEKARVDAKDFSEDVLDSLIRTQMRGASKGFLKTVPDEALRNARLREIEDQIQAGIIPENVDPREYLYESHNQFGRAGAYAMMHEFYFVFAMAPSWKNGNILEKASKRIAAALSETKAKKLYNEAFEKEYKKFRSVTRRLEQSMRSRNIGFDRLGANELLRILYREANPGRYLKQPPPQYDSSRPIREVLMTEIGGELENPMSRYATFSEVRTSDDGWEIDGYHYKVCSVRTMPQSTVPEQMMTALDAAEGEGWACVNFKVKDQRMVRRALAIRKGIQASRDRLTPTSGALAGDEIAATARAEDIALLDNATNPEMPQRVKVVDASVHVVVKDRDPRMAQERLEMVTEGLWNAGFIETLRGDAVIHSTLPLNFRAETQWLLKRQLPMLSYSMTDLLPLYERFKGYDDGRLLMNNGDGTPIYLDPWTSHTPAPHGLIVGGTGSGKSFLVNNFLLQARLQYQPKIFIIDKGASYQSFVESHGGQYVELVPQKVGDIEPICFNPFHIVEGDEEGARQPEPTEIEYMQTVLIAMCVAGTRDEKGNIERVSKVESNLIQEAIIELFKTRKPGQQFTLSDFLAHISGYGEEGVNLARRMRDFSQDGIYGELFDGQLDIDWSNPIVCIETQRMANSPAMEVLMLAVFSQIEAYVKWELPRDHHKIVVIDEAWKILAQSHLASQVAAFFRETRRYSTSINLISQAVSDFLKLVNASGGADEDEGISVNTCHYYLLGANPKDMQAARELIDISDAEFQTWRRTQSLPPFYSEFFYIGKLKNNTNYSGLVRLYSNPISLWIASSDARDEEPRRALTADYRKQGYDSHEARKLAIRDLSKEYPYGKRYAFKLAE